MKSAIATFSTSTALALLLTAQVFAADPMIEIPQTLKPAVSGINGKLDLGYIYLDPDLNVGDFNGGYAIGSLSVPLGQRFGFQIDGGYGYLSGSPSDPQIGGVGGHLFWRDPDVALLGIYGHYAALDTDSAAGTVDTWRYGVEGELYLDRFSIEAFAGADTLDGNGGSDTTFNGEALAAFYATENFRIDAGIVHQFDETLGKVGAEVMLPFGANNTSLYASGTFGNATTVKAGLRIYFGEAGKSLMGRHREDDPRSRILDYYEFDDVLKQPAAPAAGGNNGGGNNNGGGYQTLGNNPA